MVHRFPTFAIDEDKREGRAVLDLEHGLDSGYAFLDAANFRLNADFEPLGELPRFKRLIARLTRDLRYSPQAKP